MKKYNINEKDPTTYAVCRECNKKFLKINNGHLKFHNLNLIQYREKYKLSKSDCVSKQFSMGSKLTKDNFIIKYNKEEGLKKWNVYCSRQALTKTFEYKQQKYGWSKEQFNEYNKSRAVTKENMIKRHGIIDGIKKWDNYCKIQSYVGCKLEYFIEKYGKKAGIEKYNEINLKKAIGGGISRISLSNISQELFDNIFKHIPIDKNDYIFYGNHNKEYYIWYTINGIKRIGFLDFFDLKTKKCIEFYGDYWHCNPKIYNESFIQTHTQLLAKEIWEKDKKRVKFINKKYKINTLIIWECDYIENKEKIIKECLDFLGYTNDKLSSI